MRIYHLGAFIAVIASALVLTGCYNPPRPDGWQRCAPGDHFDNRASRCLPDRRDYKHPDGNRDRNRDWDRDHNHNHNPDWNHNHYPYNNWQ
jgi:hypothetical protein